MIERKTGFLILLGMVFVSSVAVPGLAETWRLQKESGLKAVSGDAEGKYLLAVSEIKRLVNTGQSEAVVAHLKKLQKDFPQIGGSDLDAFIEAELLYSKGKFAKAVRSYDKFLAAFGDSPLYEAALERQFSIATGFLAGEKKRVLKIFKIKGYAEGAKLMEKISRRAEDSPIAVRAELSVAESFEKRGKFDQAYEKWSEISQRWPMGRIGKDALLSMGRCKHAAYKGPSYDGSNLISAKSYYENFKLKYPEEAEKFDIGRRLEQIKEQLAYKQYCIGRYYQDSGNKQAAGLYYQMVLDSWPKSVASSMIKAYADGKKMGQKEGKEWKKKIIKKLEKLFL